MKEGWLTYTSCLKYSYKLSSTLASIVILSELLCNKKEKRDYLSGEALYQKIKEKKREQEKN